MNDNKKGNQVNIDLNKNNTDENTTKADGAENVAV